MLPGADENMRCKCGYCFSSEMVTEDEAKFESYAVISDKDYPVFIESEIKVFQCRDERTELAAIARSSGYVGSLLECPQCSRLLLIKPGIGSAGFYKRE